MKPNYERSNMYQKTVGALTGLAKTVPGALTGIAMLASINPAEADIRAKGVTSDGYRARVWVTEKLANTRFFGDRALHPMGKEVGLYLDQVGVDNLKGFFGDGGYNFLSGRAQNGSCSWEEDNMIHSENTGEADGFWKAFGQYVTSPEAKQLKVRVRNFAEYHLQKVQEGKVEPEMEKIRIMLCKP